VNLDKLITIEKRGEAQDSTGQPKETWTRQAPVWASIRPVSGREYYNASGPRAEITHEIVLRHNPKIAPRDRIVFEGRIFDVISPLNVSEQNRYTKLMSIEHADKRA